MKMKTIGSRIRSEREKQRISRAELARYAGIATTTLSDLELGLSKTTTALYKIAERLGVTPGYLETGKMPHADVKVSSQIDTSQSLKLDPVMLAESIAALRHVYKRRGLVFDPEQQPEVLIAAYELRLMLGSEPNKADLIDFGAKLAERVAKQHGNGDEQETDIQSGERHRKGAKKRSSGEA